MAGELHRYLLAIGSNRRHFPLGRPRRIMGAATIELAKAGVEMVRAAPLYFSRPLGPSRRRYVNSAILVETTLEPEELLELIKRIERHFGRRPGGQRWGARVLDLDIVLWDGGPYVGERLVIPHPHFRERDFVLRPAAKIVPTWRDPVTGLTVRQLNARLTARKPPPR